MGLRVTLFSYTVCTITLFTFLFAFLIAEYNAHGMDSVKLDKQQLLAFLSGFAQLFNLIRREANPIAVKVFEKIPETN